MNHKDLCNRYLDTPGVNAIYTSNGQLHLVYDKSCSLFTRGWMRVKQYMGLFPVKLEKQAPIVADRTTKHRPVLGGISIGHKDITAGTLGLPVRCEPKGVYVLSNNHVLANSNDGTVGDDILQPGPFDGGTLPADRLTSLADFVPIDFGDGTNLVDAALAGPLDEGTYVREILDVGYPTDTFGAGEGRAVYKSGRTTAVTVGVVTSDNASVNVNYGDGKQARYVDQIIVKGEAGEPLKCDNFWDFRCLLCRVFNDVFPWCSKSKPFSKGGDSGSAVLTDHRGEVKLVGLLFAGNETITIVNKQEHVFAAFPGIKLL